MKVIDMPGAGVAKVSSGDLLRELTNELGRVRRRLKRAQRKLAGLRVLKKTLQPYLQPGDYEHLLEQLKREHERWRREDLELGHRCRDERFRQTVGDEKFDKYKREHAEILARFGFGKKGEEK